MTDLSPTARFTDPRSSHHTVRSIAKDMPLREMILTYAKSRPDHPWCDTELWRALEESTGRRLQRNVIARARGLLELDGLLTRVGEWPFEGRPGVIFFLATTKEQQ